MDFVDKFVGKFGFVPSGMVNLVLDNIVSNHPSFFDMQFHLQELEEIISSAKKGSSPGKDLINNSLLKLLSMIAIQKLLDTFNKILKENSFPNM